jgi:hypothetical protein
MIIIIPSSPGLFIHIDRASCSKSYLKKRTIRWTFDPFNPVISIRVVPAVDSPVYILGYISSFPACMYISPVSVVIIIYIYVPVAFIPVSSMPLIIGLNPSGIPNTGIISLKG